MIAAVDAPCVCLNCAVHRAGPVSGADDADIELDVELELDTHAASATLTTTARKSRIDASLGKAKGGAEPQLRPAAHIVINASASGHRRLRRSRAAERV